MRIGIFGGTFNPPHLGHRHIVEDFCTQMGAIHLPLDKVLIIPTNVPPHKQTPDLASGEDRLEMCRRNFETGELPVPLEVSDIEIARADTSYTYLTLQDLHDEYPDAEFYFLMGDDMLLYLPNWARPEQILEHAVLVSTIRSNACTVEELQSFARENYPDQYRNNRFLFFESDPFPVSSTEVRELVKIADADPAAATRLQTLLDPEVRAIIRKRGLYL